MERRDPRPQAYLTMAIDWQRKAAKIDPRFRWRLVQAGPTSRVYRVQLSNWVLWRKVEWKRHPWDGNKSRLEKSGEWVLVNPDGEEHARRSD